jgi:hypothetical protein
LLRRFAPRNDGFLGRVIIAEMRDEVDGNGRSRWQMA